MSDGAKEISLRQELAVCRVIANRSIAALSSAKADFIEVKNSLNTLIEMCQAANFVEKVTDSRSIDEVDSALTLIMTTVREVCGEENIELADQITDALRQRV